MRQFLHVTPHTHLLGVLLLAPGVPQGCPGVPQRALPQTASPGSGSGCAEGTPPGHGEPCLADAARKRLFQEGMGQKITSPCLQLKISREREELGPPAALCPQAAGGRGPPTPARPIPTAGRSPRVRRCSWELGDVQPSPPKPHHMYRSRPGKLGCLM